MNHFEQLCINFANEKLQQKFTLDVLSVVQNEYREEDLPWESIEYKDNSDVLDMIEGRHSLLTLLNEECLLPRGSNQNFLAKAVTAFQKTSTFFVNVQSSRYCCSHFATVLQLLNILPFLNVCISLFFLLLYLKRSIWSRSLRRQSDLQVDYQ